MLDGPPRYRRTQLPAGFSPSDLRSAKFQKKIRAVGAVRCTTAIGARNATVSRHQLQPIGKLFNMQSVDALGSATRDGRSDAELLRKFVQEGDRAAISAIVDRHGPVVMGICRSALRNEPDAADAFQATFLVLLKKARSLGEPLSLAGWLHGVAWRVAKRATAQSMRMRSLSDSPPTALEADPATQAASDEAVSFIHEEIARLPERLRLPVILCGVLGQTRERAAQQLGCTEQTVKGRVERGRDLLEKRLRRRGCMIPAAALSTLLVERATAQVSPALAASTVNAVTQAATGALAVGGAISANALLLSQGALKAMLVTKLKVALLAACAGSVLIGSSVVVLKHVLAAPGPQTSAAVSGDAAGSEASSSDPKWNNLGDEQADEISRRHLKALIYAVHTYADAHQGKFPPAEVANPALPRGKRLSGFVLLLPYLGLKTPYVENDPEWKKWHADNAAAKRLFQSIDLKKAWDDPANETAAKTVVPEFVLPSGASFRDHRGYAVSHFAFVRGYDGKDNGAFPLEDKKEIAISDITDGTTATLGIGEIYQSLGPWIAAGPSTARFVFPAGEANKEPSFGSQYKGCAWFANCDAFTYFFDMGRTDKRILQFLAERADGNVVGADDLYRYPTSSAWKKSGGGR
jgi:RNA polymerase sigma factor (sigma-70 family)